MSTWLLIAAGLQANSSLGAAQLSLSLPSHSDLESSISSVCILRCPF